MRAGRLRHIVEHQRLVITEDDSGVPTESWLTIGTRKASVEPISGREFFEAARQQSELTHTVIMRKYDSVTTKDRFIFETRPLNVEAVIEVGERGRELQVMCKEAT